MRLHDQCAKATIGNKNLEFDRLIVLEVKIGALPGLDNHRVEWRRKTQRHYDA